jgi:hypothetical protein
MKIVGISMIGNDADIVEPFVRHNLRLLDHLVIIVHCARDGTGEILNALQAEGQPLTLVVDDEPAYLQGERTTWLARQAYAALGPDFVFPIDVDEFLVPAERATIEATLESLPPAAPAARVRLRTFVVTTNDPADEPNPLRRIRYRPRDEPKVSKIVLTPAFSADPALIIDHGNHALLRIGSSAGQLRLPSAAPLELAHYPVRSAVQLMNKTIIGYLAHLAAGRSGVEAERVATHWRRCYEDVVHRAATREMNEQQLIAWFHGRRDTEVRDEELVCDPTPTPDAMRYAYLIHNDAYSTLARFTEAVIRRRPANLDGVRFEHAPASPATNDPPPGRVAGAS